MQPALMTEQDVTNAAKRLPFMQFPDRGLCAGAILARLRAWASVNKAVPNVVQIRAAAPSITVDLWCNRNELKSAAE